MLDIVQWTMGMDMLNMPMLDMNHSLGLFHASPQDDALHQSCLELGGEGGGMRRSFL